MLIQRGMGWCGIENGGPALPYAEHGQGEDRRVVACCYLTQPIPSMRFVQYGRLREICGM